MSRTNSSASTVLAKKAATTTTSGKVGGLDAKQSTAGTSRVVVGSSKQQETGTRNRAALGELTNKDATNVTSGDQKAKSTGSKSTSTVTGRPIIARRVTRNSLAAADKPVVDGPVEPTAAGPSRSTITSTARARPAARTRPSAKNVNVKEDDTVAVAGTTKREPLTGKATSSTVNHARAGIKRTLTASTVVQTVPPAQPVALERQTSVKREIDETHHGEEENPIQPSSKRIRTSSPVKRDDAELEREPEFEHEHGRLVDVEEEEEAVARPAGVREAGVDALEDEQPYELEEDAIGMSGGRLGDMVQDIDADDGDDPTMVVEYVQDIFNYMKELEVSPSSVVVVRDANLGVTSTDPVRPQSAALVGELHAQY